MRSRHAYDGVRLSAVNASTGSQLRSAVKPVAQMTPTRLSAGRSGEGASLCSQVAAGGSADPAGASIPA